MREAAHFCLYIKSKLPPYLLSRSLPMSLFCFRHSLTPHCSYDKLQNLSVDHLGKAMFANMYVPGPWWIWWSRLWQDQHVSSSQPCHLPPLTLQTRVRNEHFLWSDTSPLPQFWKASEWVIQGPTSSCAQLNGILICSPSFQCDSPLFLGEKLPMCWAHSNALWFVVRGGGGGLWHAGAVENTSVVLALTLPPGNTLLGCSSVSAMVTVSPYVFVFSDGRDTNPHIYLKSCYGELMS